MTVQDLRDVLREQAEAPSPANPYRHEQVRSRIRRTRLRRRVTAGAAVVAAVAVGVYLVPAAPRERETTAAAQTGSTAKPGRLPESFTSGDGTEYRRLAATALKAKGETKTSVKVTVSGKPLEVAGRCDGDPRSDTPAVLVNGQVTAGPGSLPCSKEMSMFPLTVPRGVTEVTVTFDTIRVGGGCARRKKDGPCVPIEPRPANWSLAVYEWTPPAEPVEPGPVGAFPARAGGMKLADSTTGVWPRDSSFTLAVRSGSGKLGVDQLCTGDLASRLWFRIQVEGQESSGNCGVWKKGSYPMAMSEFAVPKGKRVTITGKISIWGGHTNRPVRWSVGAFVR
ncbi:hypothetical protein [Nonomuraea sp. B19D2]|uniref:hypothetical protein n=1 Tax=Nonomuraea sp. B19D2 TaxID=3159561 RepID=UPI0032DBDB13